MEKLQQTSTNQGRLLDEVTVVVVSEMGRFPQYNNRNGKEHWTYTSALLMGSGIRGGQTIGQFDPNCFGQSIDLQSGELDANGTKMCIAWKIWEANSTLFGRCRSPKIYGCSSNKAIIGS